MRLTKSSSPWSMAPEPAGTQEVNDDCAYLLAAAKWDIANGMFVNKFVERTRLPALALVTKGQHLSLGVPNVAAPQLKPYVLVHSVQTVRRCYATLVRMGKRKTTTNIHFAIPASLPGYWEMLSEDGRPVKCVESVAELIAKSPEMCLVRAACKAYQPDEDGELRSVYKSRTVHSGEVLTLVGQFHLKKTIFLRCFDERGSSVYLKVTQTGKFSPIATDDALTGVHTMTQLLSKRLPMTVRQIESPQAKLPAELNRHASHGLPIVLQLNTVYDETVVVVYSLQKGATSDTNGEIVTMPLSSHIQLSAASNTSATRRTPAFQALCQRCNLLLPQLTGTVTQVDSSEVTQHTRRRHGSTDLNTLSSGGDSLSDESPMTNLVDDDEIDQLYDYVRGLAPIPDTCVESKPTHRSSRQRRMHRQPTVTHQHTVPNSISPVDTNQSTSHHSSTSPLQQPRYLSPAQHLRPHSKVFEINQPRQGRRPRPMSVAVTSHDHPMYHMPMHVENMAQHQQAAAYAAAQAGAPPYLPQQRMYASQHNMVEPEGTTRTRHSGSRLSGGQPPQFMPLLRHNFAHYPSSPQRIPYHMSHQNLSAPQQHRFQGFVPQLAPFT